MKRLRRAPQPKPLPFTEKQIQARAYVIWQERGQASSPEENWQAAIEALKREQSLTWKLKRFWQTAVEKENRNFSLDVIKVFISAFGVLATLFAGVGLYLTYQNSQAERQLNVERMVTDRFAKAVEQLGSQDVHVRLGAIYSLERIAKDSPKDHWTVMEVLTAYVRNKSPVPKEWLYTLPEKRKSLPEITTDVQSALTVIGRREVKNDPQNKRLNLGRSNLNRADLNSANLRGIFLQDSNLDEADLNSANLVGANLSSANLWGAGLVGANLVGADLSSATLWRADLAGTNLGSATLTRANLQNAVLERADLSSASLAGTNLSGAYLRDANLAGASLVGADLSRTYFWGTNLRGADLIDAREMTPEQIKRAKNWQLAQYDNGLRKKLGLPLAKP